MQQGANPLNRKVPAVRWCSRCTQRPVEGQSALCPICVESERYAKELESDQKTALLLLSYGVVGLVFVAIVVVPILWRWWFR